MRLWRQTSLQCLATPIILGRHFLTHCGVELDFCLITPFEKWRGEQEAVPLRPSLDASSLACTFLDSQLSRLSVLKQPRPVNSTVTRSPWNSFRQLNVLPSTSPHPPVQGTLLDRRSTRNGFRPATLLPLIPKKAHQPVRLVARSDNPANYQPPHHHFLPPPVVLELPTLGM